MTGWLAAAAAVITWVLLVPGRRIPWQVVDLGIGTRAAPVEPPAPAPAVAPIARSRRRRAAGRTPRLHADLPAAVDLLQVAVTAGHPLSSAVGAVGRHGTGEVGAAFATLDRRVRRGELLVDELERLAVQLGPQVRPLVTTLVVAHSSGAPLGPTLQRLADAERRRLRRRTEERVRRLPVLLLAPLIGLVLPAFVVLTIVPVALTTARSLGPAFAGPTALPPNPPSIDRSPP
jgi:pilus assembly protein TadC